MTGFRLWGGARNTSRCIRVRDSAVSRLFGAVNTGAPLPAAAPRPADAGTLFDGSATRLAGYSVSLCRVDQSDG